MGIPNCQNLGILNYRLHSVGNGDVAEYYALILMSLLIYSNIISIISGIYIVSGIKIDIGQGSKIVTGLLFFCLLILFDFLFLRKSKHLEIVNEYGQETVKKKIIGNAFIIGYILISVGLLMLCFYFMIQKNKGLM
ncbi:MAG: hypothetical protein EOM36_00395 [Bacteroidia bacterium]|nr:hypothetical protein [Bacteroidia bacterium]